jgi:hypothetical protein
MTDYIAAGMILFAALGIVYLGLDAIKSTEE